MVNAQQAYENTAQLDKKSSGSCVSIKVKLTAKDAQKVMENLFKSEGLKGGKSSGGKIAYEAPIMFSTISPGYINLFVSFDEASKDKNAPVTIVNFFVKKGADAPYENSRSDSEVIANVKNFLDQKYSSAVYDYDIAMKIEAKKKEIEQAKKDLDNLQKQIDNRTKDIAGYEKDIEKAKANIEKAKNDIENTNNSIENQKQVLTRKQEELTQIK
ncbi:hypothetical protein FACS1894182_07970 [Bacteroidia bacterium]|nr:hypothetical protein FACS1894182_07970 [Bacteroidia bacterium]